MSRLHPRERVVRQAQLDLMEALNDWQRDHELTDAEYVSLVANELGSRIGSLTRMQIRTERHGTTDKPGGLE